MAGPEPLPDGILARPRELGATFNRIAAGYDARPGYPHAVFDLLAHRCGVGAGTRVVEVGPGLGQATVPLLDLGAEVVAVEPGAELARLLQARASSPHLEVRVSAFEDVVLPDDAFDLVCAATSFHWVDPVIGLAKAAALLRDGGWLALWWTIWGDPTRPDPFHDALLPILRRKAPEITRAEHGPDAYLTDLAARARLVASNGSFGPVWKEQLRWESTHDPAALRGIFGTFAGWIALPDDTRDDLLDDVETLARDSFGGSVTRPYQTVIYLAQRLRRS